MDKIYYVYIMASSRNGTLNIGETDDLVRCVYEHKNDFVKGFTKKYGAHMLVYYEACDSKDSALVRGKTTEEEDLLTQ
jgi:putative endonuclease